MQEAKNDYNIEFGPYSIELKGNQIYYRKNNSLMKAMPVKSTFGLYDLKKLAKKVAASVNMTSKLPKDVLKASVSEAKLPKRFTVKTKQRIGDVLYNPGTYALKKKRWGGGIYLNMDNNQMLGVDAENIAKLSENEINEGDYGYYVWSGTYGKDDPRKMKDLTYVKDLDASIKISKKLKAKHGNSRALRGLEFQKDFPKAYKQWKSVNEKRDLLQGDLEESTAQWEKTIKALAHKDALKKLKKGDKEKLIKIAQMIKTANENKLQGGDPSKDIKQVDIIKANDELEEDFVRSGHMYKSLTYKVKDQQAVYDAYKKFKKGNRTIHIVATNKGDTVTFSGHPTKGMWMSPGIADQLDVAIQKTGKATLVKSDSKKLKENKMNESEIKFRKMIREIAEPMLKSAMNEISTQAGLNDVIKGRTTTIEGIKFSKELAEALLYWVQTSPYGRKYGKHILKGRIASLIGPANAMGFGDRLKGKLKGEWKALFAKHGPKREDVVKELKEIQLTEMSDSQMLKMAMKGAKAARVGSTAIKAYMDSLKNSWRLDPKSKKDYKDFTVDDWEEDVLYYIQNKG